MCLAIIKNQYNGAIMEVKSELDTNIIYLCNDSVLPDGINLTKNNTTVSITPPGHTDSSFAVIIVYCVLFVIAAAGNLSVVITLFRSRRHRRSRVSLMMCHLAVADLMVAFIMIPLEVGWRITVEWHAGNVACKVFLFMRAFCLYLSSNVLVCVSLDRCFAVIYPLRVSAARKRGKTMLIGAWMVAFVNAIPQSIIFRVQQHPKVPGFMQCVTFGFFPNDSMENAYNLFCVVAMYFLPLMIISGAYSVILCEISNRTNRSRGKDDVDTGNSGVLRLRCSDLTQIERARQRTLRLTVTIVAVFVWCWTPYVVMTLWYVFDRESALKVDNAVQDGLFLMAVSNSCMNPLVYGSYAMKCKCPCNKQRRNDVQMGVTAVALPRRSTGSGANGASEKTIREKDIIFRNTNEKKNFIQTKYGNNIIRERNKKSGTFMPIYESSKHGEQINVGGTGLRKNYSQHQQSSSSQLPQTFLKNLRYPSSDHIMTIADGVSLIIGPRPSFHSEPTPNKCNILENSNVLTRSLDTGGWR